MKILDASPGLRRLAKSLIEKTGDSGPWLLYADGSVEAWPETPRRTDSDSDDVSHLTERNP